MQPGSAGSICCLALLATIAGAGATTAQNQLNSLDLKHAVFKRSTNNSENMDAETNSINSTHEQVSTTEVISVVHESEKSEEEVKRVDRSGEIASAYKDLDAVLKVAQAQPEIEVRTSSALTEAETETITEQTKANSNSYGLQNTSSDHDLGQSQAPSAVESTSLAQPDKENKQLRRGSGLYEPGYSRTLVPRSEMIYLDNVNGAENLVSCTREDELYKLQTPWKECLVCACMRERGRVQPVCVNCANCADDAPAPAPALPPSYLSSLIPSTPPILPPTFDPQILIPQVNIQQVPVPQISIQELQPKQEIEIPGISTTCAPFPYGVPFEHPLNPCQSCVCQRDILRGNELFVTCKENSQCAKQQEIPLLPATPLSASITATLLCEKFPKDVVFPHPTDACKICKCLAYTTPLGITEQQILCNPDPICGGVSAKLQPTPELPLLVESYPHQDKSQIFTFGPSAPKQVYPPQSPEWVNVPQNKVVYPHFTFTTPASPPQMPSIITAPEGYSVPSSPGILIPQGQIFASEQSEPILIAEAVAFDGSDAPIPSSPGIPKDVYPIRELDYFITKQTETPAKSISPQQDLIPWPPLTIPAGQRERSHGPLLGPPPHQSCQPYTTNTPFQHPWDDCQLCVCEEFNTPGHVSIEVNCYTKGICCRIGDIASPLMGLEQLSIQSQNIQNNSPKVQLLDPMCELKTFGVEFSSPSDQCKVCSCHQVGSLIVPTCRIVESPLCKRNVARITPGLMTFIEPKCRNRPPDKPFLADCNVCVCQTVFTYVIAKCTPQPNCINKDGGNDSIGVRAIASANAQSGGSYAQSLINTLPMYESRNYVLPSSGALYTEKANALSQLQGNNNYQFGQYQQNPIYGFRPQSTVSPAQDAAARLMALLNQNSQINVIKATASGQLGISPDVLQNNVQPSWSLPQTTTSGAPAGAQSFSSAQAFIDAINGPLQQNQNSYYEYPKNLQQVQSGPELIFEATSIVTPSNNYGFNAQKPYQNILRNYPDRTQISANSVSTTPASQYSNTAPWNFKQPDVTTWIPTEASPTNYLASSHAYAYGDSSVTPFAQKTAAPSPWDSTTLAYVQSEANARALVQAAATTGSIRGGRGQCQYAGDMYHHNCQACSCFADEHSGELYSMCSGIPCH